MSGLYRCGCDFAYTWNRPDGMFPSLIWSCPEHHEPPYFFEPYKSGKEMTYEFSSRLHEIIMSESSIMRYLKFTQKPIQERIKILAGLVYEKATGTEFPS